jgi:hypothetical protein
LTGKVRLTTESSLDKRRWCAIGPGDDTYRALLQALDEAIEAAPSEEKGRLKKLRDTWSTMTANARSASAAPRRSSAPSARSVPGPVLPALTRAVSRDLRWQMVDRRTIRGWAEHCSTALTCAFGVGRQGLEPVTPCASCTPKGVSAVRYRPGSTTDPGSPNHCSSAPTTVVQRRGYSRGCSLTTAESAWCPVNSCCVVTGWRKPLKRR